MWKSAYWREVFAWVGKEMATLRSVWRAVFNLKLTVKVDEIVNYVMSTSTELDFDKVYPELRPDVPSFQEVFFTGVSLELVNVSLAPSDFK